MRACPLVGEDGPCWQAGAAGGKISKLRRVLFFHHRSSFFFLFSSHMVCVMRPNIAALFSIVSFSFTPSLDKDMHFRH